MSMHYTSVFQPAAGMDVGVSRTLWALMYPCLFLSIPSSGAEMKGGPTLHRAL